MTSHLEAHRQPSFLLKKKFLLIFGVLLILFTGFMGTVYLVQQQTTTNTRADWVGDGDNNLVWHWKCTKTTFRNETCDSEQRETVDNFDVYTHENFNPENWNCEDDHSHRDYTGCQFIGNACIGGTQPGDLNSCIASLTTTPRPSIDPGNRCGDSCDENNPCTSGYQCTQDRVCWNDNVCGNGEEPPMARIEGRVLNCAGEPVAGVKAKAWGVTTSTNNNGRFRIAKNIQNLNDVQFMQGTVLIGADVLKQNPANDTDVNKFFSSQIAGSQIQPYDALEITCQHVNCTYSGKVGDGSSIPDDQKLFGQGPIRKTYRFQEMTDDYFSDNFVSSTRYTKSFDFKETNCPAATLTPTSQPLSGLSCGERCTNDNDCASTPILMFCATQWNPQGYSWSPAHDSDFNIGWDSILGTGAKLTGLNAHLSADLNKFELHAIKGGKVFYRERPVSQNDWWGIGFTHVTESGKVNIVGCKNNTTDSVTEENAVDCNNYKIIDFNSHIFRDNGTEVIEQHLLRNYGTDTKIFYRQVRNRNWNTLWAGPATGLDNVGIISGQNNTITSFNSYVDQDGNRVQSLVRGGRVYQRQLGIYSHWLNSSNIFNTCTNSGPNTGNGKCGTNINNQNPIVSYKVIKMNDELRYAYLVREEGDVYKLRSSALKDNGQVVQVCKPRQYPWSSCPAPTPVP